MKNFKALILLILVTSITTSCFEDNDDTQTPIQSINNFVWKGMNSWYKWQPNVPDLSDSKTDNSTQYESFLNKFSNPKDLFNSLRYQIGVTDRFSWFVEDYIELQQQFQGITKSFGMRFTPVEINSSGDVILYIKHVALDSPANDANIKRGDIINAIDGTTLNTNNYNDLANKLFGETVTLSFVSENNGTLSFIDDKTITASVISENPIFLKKVFNDINGKKVGYLVYNGFRSSYNDELNDTFLFFKNENINELIIDLRLNGGGSVSTAAYLASMIYSSAGTDIFTDLKFNSKHSEQEDGSYNFGNTLNVFDSNSTKVGEQTINRLNNINRLYVLTSNNTASASELIINGLRPYLNAVKVVGTTTFGKNVGSITLYDSPNTDYTERTSANKTHTKAMQPIVFKTFNKDGESDYTQGFTPDIEIEEHQFWNNILPFGDENEVVLKGALDDIRGVTTKTSSTKKSKQSKQLKIKEFKNMFDKEMYIDN